MEELSYFDKWSFLNLIPEACGRSSSDFTPCSFTSLMFNYVVSGEGVYCLQGKEYAVRAGDIFVIPPYQINSQRCVSEREWEKLWVAGEVIGSETTSLLQTLGLSEPVITAPGLKSLFVSIVQNHESSSARSYYVNGQLYELIYRLREMTDNTGINPYVERAKRYIQQHYQENLSVSELASQVGLERSYFSRLFFSCTKMAPRDYVTDYRLSQAIRMIGDGEMNINEIAVAVGYRDVYTFSRAFKKKFLVSPNNFKPIRFNKEAGPEPACEDNE